MDFISCLLLVGGIGTRVRHFMVIAATGDYALVISGACLVLREWRKCLGVGWWFVFIWDLVFLGGGWGI